MWIDYQSQIIKHMKTHDMNEEDCSYNCTVCSYQSMNRDQLTEHIERTHETENICKTCNKNCSSKAELDNHIYENHMSYKPCKNFPTNNCEYDDECRYRHVILKQGEQLCYKCGDKFSGKSFLLNHIKNMHNDPCRKHIEGKCSYGTRCVFKHIAKIAQNVAWSPRQTEVEQDFQTAPTKDNRLVGVQITQDQLMMNMNSLVMQMSQMMKQWISQKRNHQRTKKRNSIRTTKEKI